MLYDVAVIGGGIHGVGIAQAASALGYRVALLEQTELAAGTSSRSSKLIHGGLRYLEHGQVGLVRECLHERQILLDIAPDLVHLKPFYIPVFPNTRRRPATLAAGLALYGALTGFRRSATFKMIGRRHWHNLDGLKTDNLQAVFRYWDAQTDDQLLTRAVCRSAQELGTELIMPARVTGAQFTSAVWQVQYLQKEKQQELTARVIVNAAGPWVNHVLNTIDAGVKPLPIDWVQGTHIILDAKVAQGIYYVEAPSDGRAVFVMPWYGQMMVGTTEKHFDGDPVQVAPTSAEIQYLLATLAHYFPAYQNAKEADVVRSFAGLRVLPAMPGSAFSRPRDTILHVDDETRPRVLTVYGGKLTAYRITAKKVLEKVLPSLSRPVRHLDTAKIKLSP